jgi:hypothetical protein
MQENVNSDDFDLCVLDFGIDFTLVPNREELPVVKEKLHYPHRNNG